MGGEPSNFHLTARFSDIWRSDDTLLKKLGNTAVLSNYEVPNRDAEIAQDRAREAELAARTQVHDAMRDSIPYTAGYLIAVAANKSPEERAKYGEFARGIGGAIGAGVMVGQGISARASQVNRPAVGPQRGVGGAGYVNVPNTTATSIGKSGYASVQEFSNAAYTRYQGLVDEGYTAAQQALQDGTLRVPAGVSQKTVLGQFTDDYARTYMQDWLAGEGIDEGAGQLIQVNRYLRDPAGSGSYRIPDVSIPGANQIYDATLGFKSWSTPQVRGFYQYSNGSNITIVRPTQLGGSYSVLVLH